MLYKTHFWLVIAAADHKERMGQSAGKWQCFGSRADLHRHVKTLNRLVEDGTFLAAKLTLKDPDNDPFPDRPCVLCVFTTDDPKDKDRVSKRLVELGLQPSRWKSQEETRRDWEPGGKLRKALEKNKSSTPPPSDAWVEDLDDSSPDLGQTQKTAKMPEATPTPARRWDVFLCKNSKDLAHAMRVYQFLTKRGLRVFLSEVSLKELGKADFQAGIEQGLEESSHLVVVASARTHLESQWVTGEWRTFLNEIRSGRKTGNVVTVLADQLRVQDLPLSLRAFEAHPLTDQGLADLVAFLRT